MKIFSTDGIIRDDSQNTTWINPIVETIYASTPPYNAVFDMRGLDITLIKPIMTLIDPSKCPNGIVLYSGNTYTIIEPRTFGSKYPDYALALSGSGPWYATIMSPNLRSKYWSHLNGKTDTLRFIGGNLQTQGTATFSGDGSTTQFKIKHNLPTTPNLSKTRITPLSADAADNFWIDVDNTYIYVNYKTAPPSGTDNIKVSWYAEV